MSVSDDTLAGVLCYIQEQRNVRAIWWKKSASCGRQFKDFASPAIKSKAPALPLIQFIIHFVVETSYSPTENNKSLSSRLYMKPQTVTKC